jgi:hypothetical protein
VLDPLGADEFGGDALDRTRGSPKDEDLQAVVMIEVDVKRRDDLLMMRMLLGREAVRKIRGVVIVDERDRSDGLSLTGLPLLLDERRTHEIAYRLGPVHVAALGNELVEPVEQTLVCRDPESDHASHSAPFRTLRATSHVQFVSRSQARPTSSCELRPDG